MAIAYDFYINVDAIVFNWFECSKPRYSELIINGVIWARFEAPLGSEVSFHICVLTGFRDLHALYSGR